MYRIIYCRCAASDLMHLWCTFTLRAHFLIVLCSNKSRRRAAPGDARKHGVRTHALWQRWSSCTDSSFATCRHCLTHEKHEERVAGVKFITAVIQALPPKTLQTKQSKRRCRALLVCHRVNLFPLPDMQPLLCSVSTCASWTTTRRWPHSSCEACTSWWWEMFPPWFGWCA